MIGDVGLQYVVGDDLQFVGGGSITPAHVEVTAIRLYDRLITNGGTGYAIGNLLTIPGDIQDGIFQVTAVNGLGTITNGQLNIDPITSGPNASPYATTGGAGTGALITLQKQGLGLVVVTVPGEYTARPDNPITTANLSGPGSGGTVSAIWTTI
jgi:hypothetical protein